MLEEDKDIFSKPAPPPFPTGCPPVSDSMRQLQNDVRELFKKVAVIEVLDFRVTRVESVIAEIRTSITATSSDIHKIQQEIEADNIIQKWVGRIVTGLLSAVIAFLIAKYGNAV